MSFLTGETKQSSNVTPETSGLYKDLISFIKGQGFSGLNPIVNPDDASLQPFLKLFSQQNAHNFAQAKESTGNLTGSGAANVMGNAASKADTEQGAFLANLLEGRRTNDANRRLQLIMGALGSPAGATTTTYQPGFIDYAAQGATALAGGGAFNSLFNKKPGA